MKHGLQMCRHMPHHCDFETSWYLPDFVGDDRMLTVTRLSRPFPESAGAWFDDGELSSVSLLWVPLICVKMDTAIRQGVETY